VIQLDRLVVDAGLDRVFACASDVEQWPTWLKHYRWVRFLERDAEGGLVEMAARRPFGPFGYPTWWVSRMRIDRLTPAIHYRHVRGITRGMDVEWAFVPTDAGVAVTVTHVWGGPSWPVVGAAAGALVIGPVFVHGIAQRTLAGIARVARGEARA
jgi:ribosome-associated toxin RatA of RatAB toxin-antitoxin module